VANSYTRQLIIQWNNKFPLDRWLREKNKIIFNSEVHRSISQLDILFEFLEEKMFKKLEEDSKKKKEKIEEFKNTGNWLNEGGDIIESEEDQELFNNLDLSKLNQAINGGK
jgi:hypothetical protein